MMYNNKLVASVKVDGKIMREDGETVYIPFGSEYSLLLKNLNGRKALVKIEIDGEEVTGSGGVILNANQTIDLERFILDGNLDKGPKFKFIEKTERISDNRGDRVEDGIVRVSYKFEKAYEPVSWYYSDPLNTYYRSTPIGGSGGHSAGGSGGNQVYGQGFFSNVSVGSSIDGASQSSLTSTNDAGITTKGSESDQKFSHGWIGTLESTEHVICLQLKGQVGEHVVQRPVAVTVKYKCDVCGKGNIPSGNKFCPECGTNLTYKW